MAAVRRRPKGRGPGCEGRLKGPGRAARAAYTRSVAVAPQLRGFLRIYLGAAAGVGKTYQMLGDARLAAEEGADRHRLPRAARARRHRGARARPRARAARALRRRRAGGERARLDWLLERRPSVAIIDELAHTNAAGSPRRSATTTSASCSTRHRRLDDRQHPAPREPQQPHPRAHRRRGARDVPRPAAPRGRRDQPRRPQPPLAARAHRPRPRLPARARRAALAGFFTVENLTALRALVLHELAEVAAGELRAVARRTAQRARPGRDRRRRDSYAPWSAPGRAWRGAATRSSTSSGRAAGRPRRRRDRARAGRRRGLTRRSAASSCAGGPTTPPPRSSARPSAQHITQIVVGKSRRSAAARALGGSLVEAVLRGTSGIDVHVVADPCGRG